MPPRVVSPIVKRASAVQEVAQTLSESLFCRTCRNSWHKDELGTDAVVFLSCPVCDDGAPLVTPETRMVCAECSWCEQLTEDDWERTARTERTCPSCGSATSFASQQLFDVGVSEDADAMQGEVIQCCVQCGTTASEDSALLSADECPEGPDEKHAVTMVPIEA